MHRPRPPALVLLLALLSGCNLRFEQEWPVGGERWLTGRQRTIDGEARAIGHWTFWYPDGTTKQAQGFFDHGPLPQPGGNAVGGTRIPRENRTKKWMMWDPEGRLLSQGIFKDGLRDDLWACFAEDGMLCCTGNFELDRPTGFHVTWVDGARRDEHHYVDGLLDGPRVVRDARGAVVWQGTYTAGAVVSAEPAGAPEPALHRLELCAEAAEDGLRVAPEGDPRGASDAASSPELGRN